MRHVCCCSASCQLWRCFTVIGALACYQLEMEMCHYTLGEWMVD